MARARKQGAGEGGLQPPIFGKTVRPISTRGAGYAHHITSPLPRIFRPCDGPDYYLEKKMCKLILKKQEQSNLKYPQGLEKLKTQDLLFYQDIVNRVKWVDYAIVIEKMRHFSILGLRWSLMAFISLLVFATLFRLREGFLGIN